MKLMRELPTLHAIGYRCIVTTVSFGRVIQSVLPAFLTQKKATERMVAEHAQKNQIQNNQRNYQLIFLLV